MRQVRMGLFSWGQIAGYVLVALIALVLSLTACHRQQTQVVVQPSADYSVQSTWTTEPVYDAGAIVVCVGGRRGYYDHYRVFHPVVVVGGFEGYYDSGHRFVSSAPEIRVRVQQRVNVHRPEAPPPARLDMKGPMQTWHAVPRSQPAPAVKPAPPVRAVQIAPPRPAPAPRSAPVALPSARAGGGGRR